MTKLKNSSLKLFTFFIVVEVVSFGVIWFFFNSFVKEVNFIINYYF